MPLARSPTRVQLIDVISIGDDLSCAPSSASLVRGPRIRRRVVLENAKGEQLMYAVSWWAADAYKKHLSVPTLPIGTSITAARLELFRQMIDISTGNFPGAVFSNMSNPSDSHESGSEVVWARSYLMFNGGQAIALIYEIFSPILRRTLGPYAIATC